MHGVVPQLHGASWAHRWALHAAQPLAEVLAEFTDVARALSVLQSAGSTRWGKIGGADGGADGESPCGTVGFKGSDIDSAEIVEIG